LRPNANYRNLRSAPFFFVSLTLGNLAGLLCAVTLYFEFGDFVATQCVRSNTALSSKHVDAAAMQPAKRPRLSSDAVRDLLHVGRVSMQGLSQLLGRLPANLRTSPMEIRRLNQTAFRQHRVADVLRLKDGSDFTWEYVCPASWAATLISKTPLLQTTFATAINRQAVSRASPWRMVVAFDEFAPGNKLQFDNRFRNATGNLRRSRMVV
jgi:hypothetical protein